MDRDEARIQSECVLWLWNNRPETRGHFFAVNNNSQNKTKGAIMKAMGVVAGVSDTILLWKGKAYLLECKKPNGIQSQVQLDWEQSMSEHGFEYSIYRSRDDFEKIITKIIDNE